MPKVLLVEDDEQLARFLMRFLNSEGYTTDYANGQRDALLLFEGNAYDCVLLDISLKDGNGYSTCAAIKAQNDTPVIFITASADEACTVAGFEIGADDYIGKPFGTRELLARMKWMIETMLSLSRIEADAVKFAKNTVSCRELIAQSIETVSVTAELKSVEIRTEINGEPEFIGDLHYTSEAIVNLLKNAIEHTPQGGTVTVTANGSNISSNITIADTGEGIPEKELPHIFERFYRSSEYTKNGFGIGLAFAKKVISAQDGSLKAANHKPHGAMFDIHFYKTTI